MSTGRYGKKINVIIHFNEQNQNLNNLIVMIIFVFIDNLFLDASKKKQHSSYQIFFYEN
jgi:hypothetical protein